jgi:ATP-dependent DNA helicase RecQ
VFAMIEYVNNLKICRSKMIAAYFNDHEVKPCGICDNCISQQQLPLNKVTFEMIANQLFELLKTQSISFEAFSLQIKEVKKEKVWEVVNYLIAEKKISIDAKGVINQRV